MVLLRPQVVANAVAALAEISEASNKDVFQINSNMLQKLLAALNECTEWGQVFLLDCLAQYQPSPKEAESIIERVTQRLQHANSAVAMSAIKASSLSVPRVTTCHRVSARVSLFFTQLHANMSATLFLFFWPLR